MDEFFFYATIVLTVSILIPLYRVARGPTVFDQLLAVGAVGSKTIGLICLFGLHFERLSMFVDIALAYAILNFIAGITIAKYFEREWGNCQH